MQSIHGPLAAEQDLFVEPKRKRTFETRFVDGVSEKILEGVELALEVEFPDVSQNATGLC